MKIWMDMHIHSCLSPCASEEMTPNNIINMAKLKGLQMISVTDHNTAKNLPAVFYAAEKSGICAVPGLETESREGVHILAYFKQLDSALCFGEVIYRALPDILNSPQFFGEQTLYNLSDEIIGHEPKLLIQSLDMSAEELVFLIRKYGGEPVPAHIDKPGHGIIDVLGFIHPSLNIHTIELSKPGMQNSKYSKQYVKILHSSDAHVLEDISEKEFLLNMNRCSAGSFIQYISH